MINKAFLVLIVITAGLTPRAEAQSNNPNLLLLNTLCNDPSSPFKYDKKLDEYSITIRKTDHGKTVISNYPIHFCPFTGVPLPDGRGNLFFDVDESLLEKIAVQLSNAKTLDQVQNILGKPDKDLPGDSAINVPRTFVYTSLSKTTDINIQEKGPLGFVIVAATGKEKPDSK